MPRDQIGSRISEIVPIDFLVPGEYQRWRPLVQDAFAYVFTHLSEPRLAPKIAEQFAFPAGTPYETRLLRLIGKMPGLQKLGQVLARNRRLAQPLRKALVELENGMSDVTAAQIRAIIMDQLGARLETFAVKLESSI